MGLVLPRIGVGVVIVNASHEILLILRKRNPEANKWSIPGGKVEPYERLEDAAVREVKEEIGADIVIDSLLCMAETISPDTEEHWVSSIYAATIIGGNIQNMEPDAIAGIGWFSLTDLPENLACFTEPAVKAMLEKLKLAAV